MTHPAGRPTSLLEALPPELRRFHARHARWLDKLGIRDRPWLVFGSAPEPTVPREILGTHARIDINNAGRTAQEHGFVRADLTMRAKKKSWEEHPHVDTNGLLWIHTAPAMLLRLVLLRRPFDHIGSLATITRRDRDAIVVLVSGADPQAIGDLGKVTNGLAAACYGLFLGVPEVVLAGISLSKIGHSYDELGRRRRQVDEDAFILEAMKDDPRLSTTEPDLAKDTGLRLWTPASR